MKALNPRSHRAFVNFWLSHIYLKISGLFKIKSVFVPFYVQIFTFSFFCGTIWTFLAVKNMAQLSAEVHLLFHQLAIEPFATLILRYGSAPICFSSFFISSSGMPTITYQQLKYHFFVGVTSMGKGETFWALFRVRSFISETRQSKHCRFCIYIFDKSLDQSKSMVR